MVKRPVSYTHLDVYKRQVIYSLACTGFLSSRVRMSVRNMGMDEWEGSAVTWAELREKQLSPDSVWARRIPSFLQKIPSLPYLSLIHL